MTTPTAAIVEEGPPLDALENANHIVGEALQNVEVGEIISAITAAELETQYPLTETMRANIEAGREVVRQNLDHGNNRMMAIIGECGIVDPEITLELMRKLRHEVQPLLTMIDIVGRGNYDKPRTVGGFPGVVHMPNLETDDPNAGVEMVWRLQREIAEIGIPYSTEMLTPNNSPIAEPFLSAGWVGSRSVTDHSQKKQIAVQNMPMLIKTSMAGGSEGVQGAINAMKYASNPSGKIDKDGINIPALLPVVDRYGRTGYKRTTGNTETTLIARGGSGDSTNTPEGRDMIRQKLVANGLGHRAYIEDMGHDHGKNEQGRKDVSVQLQNIYDLAQDILGNPERALDMAGIMVEASHVPENSITDPLVHLDNLIPALIELDRALQQAAEYNLNRN